MALVESVNLSAGTVVVSEDHWQGDFDWRTYKISDITGFLHVGTPPSSSVDSPPATTPVTTDTPTISGTAEVGKKLTAKPGDWEKGATFAYQWLRDKKSIGGATKSTYTLTGDDLGAKITVKVTGSKKGFVSASKTSAATAKVAVGTLTATPVPTISGTPKVLKKLTADAGAWAPAGVAFSYQWLRDGEAIKGATGSSYVVADADLGSLLSVTVTGTKDGFTSVSTASEPTAQIAAAGAGDGPDRPTEDHRCRPGRREADREDRSLEWASSVKPTYTWLRNGKPIKGATKSSYTLVADDLTAQISVVVTGAPSGYISASIASEATAAVVPGILTATPKPKVTGTAKVLKKLTAKAGAWAPAGITLTYQWRRDGKSIAGATKSSYVLTAEDLGAKISVKVKGKKRGFTTVSKVSSSTARIAAPDKVKAPSAKPAVSGTARVGKKLTAKTAAWRTSGVTLSYTWRRDGKKIKAATASSYTLTADDLGKRISVKVTGARSGYASASKTSVETAKVAVGILSATPKPTISGTARVGEKLTATAGSWKPSKVTLSYSWTRDGVPIAGATKSSYVLKVEDLGAKIGVKVTGSKVGFTAVSTTATPTAKVRIGRFVAPTPTVSGRESVLATLTVDPGKWTPKDAALTVQWLRDGIDIAGAMGVEYVLTADDLDAEIGVKVTGTKEGFGPLAVTAVAVAAVGPPTSVSAPTTKPTISGTVQVGKKVTAKARLVAVGDRALLPVAARRRGHQGRDEVGLHACRRRQGRGDQRGGDGHGGRLRADHGLVRTGRGQVGGAVRDAGSHDLRDREGRKDADGGAGHLGAGDGEALLSVAARRRGHQGRDVVDLHAGQGRQGREAHREGQGLEERLHVGVEDLEGDSQGRLASPFLEPCGEVRAPGRWLSPRRVGGVDRDSCRTRRAAPRARTERRSCIPESS